MSKYKNISLLIGCLFLYLLEITSFRLSINKLRITNTKTYALDDAPLDLCEENIVSVIEELKKELGTIFGYDDKSREVGITGEIEFTDVDGPVIFIALKGRFWHATDTIMLRVQSYVKQRIPGTEISDFPYDFNDSRRMY